MKRSRLAAIVLVLVCHAITPAPASAHIGWWDWLEELSGPGPFKGHGKAPNMFDFRVRCRIKAGDAETWASDGRRRELTGDERSAEITNSGRMAELQTFGHTWAACSTLPAYARDARKPRVTDFVEVRTGGVSTDPKPIFADEPARVGIVKARTVQLSYVRQIQGFSVGAGAGILWFQGDIDRNPIRVTATPLSAIIRPLEFIPSLERFGDLFQFRIEAIALLGGLKATDFVADSTSTFKTGSEMQLSRSFSINFLIPLR